LDPLIPTICTLPNDNEAFYKVSSFIDLPSRRRRECKLSHTLLDPPELKEKLLDLLVPTICTSTNDNEDLYKVLSLYDQPISEEK
jgi:hypothetical protein